MYDALIKLYLIAAALQFGVSLNSLSDCSGRQCLKKLDRAAHEVLTINWKPISVFPDEAKRFKQ